MAPEAWESNETSEGYSDLLVGEAGFLPFQVLAQLQYQRPWHSKIRLPIEGDADRDADFCHVESHDLDCLLIVLRALISFKFCPENRYRRSALFVCALHSFGWDRRADYGAKGMLVAKLFPDHLDDPGALRPVLTFKNLVRHPAVERAVFGQHSFALKSRQLLISDPGSSADVESIIASSFEDLAREGEVKWDGVMTLGRAVADQSYDLDLAAENGTKIARRYGIAPPFLRVSFTPDEHHPRGFDDVQSFRLATPLLRRDGDMMVEVASDHTYHLAAVVRMNPGDPVGDQAEVRLYDIHGRMMLPEIESNSDHRRVIERKIRPDSGWKVGDPAFEFALFYTRWDPDLERLCPLSPTPDPPAEYLSPPPVYPYQFAYVDNSGSESGHESDDSDVGLSRSVSRLGAGTSSSDSGSAGSGRGN
ncbi:hypothetical protein EKO27_g11416 [Xylaria grammica]|uniref:Uncharacterized protein n=1 Tax=Xylaria grammica TaxID=363999 RepID=A0A439CNF5_9PEZI|nr:hypothetical protein EKO27_g11416 [Xylaria grammica]